ncbi:3-oxoacyl-ACP reductase FabG [Moritella viscosa]|uniref:3-oxoacyl-[acyl-carrier-protein] reductase n=1 Tax=Moritella viscosa TaxID=80854 RepID=A0A090ICW6_9GAMM|nr:3-oxoacyl-ACP reductase FabG [Moritella viscosa]CED60085.1 3-oxoacyl-[acyl-carrier protein] reductase [Moritella viscosa]SGY99298.1 3-oxoacyl-(Acyl-carrier-protein) reductase [Moritella viscosa]SGZ06558.1 3-oxoacyl-(Acyl-carrier-protein) reductase [Moritella viscosa]SGZ14026.1 3-oxoacyl-(Acyl-carrier-protein) reductase [Moritella viscosa]SGZ14165.1 3-oxoacyl-(Acyl-carrier-protein) reductase [Moritella viscosa]
MSFSSKTVLVTGASRGIGRAIAEHFAKLGAQVIGTATSAQGAERIGAYLGDAGFGLELNVTNQDSVDALYAEIKTRVGHIDILVNNAGITADNIFLRMKEDEWCNVIDTNLTSLYRLCKPCLRGMMKQRFGRIINIGSVVGSTGNGGQANYAAAKSGLLGFTKSLASEIASRGITVNAVAPGFIETDMTSELSEEQKQTILAQVPTNRLGSTVEIAETVGFLASDGASYITGETIHVNGGMYMA